MKQKVKEIIVRSIGLVLATFFGGTAIGAVAGDWFMGAIIGVGSAFAVVLTMIGVSLAWSGELTLQAITNAYRAAVSKAAEENDSVKEAIEVQAIDGEFTVDDIDFDDEDLEEYNKY